MLRIFPVFVSLPNQLRLLVEYSDSVSIIEDITLHNVFYIPQFSYNLLSISVLTRDLCHLNTIFSNGSCVIQDMYTSQTIGNGSLLNGLYFHASSVGDATTASLVGINCHSTFNVHKPSFDICHNCFGHSSFKRISVLVLSFEDVSYKDHICSVCPLAKQKRLSFDSHNNMSAVSFDLVHADIQGPNAHATSNGYRYFFTHVDDHNRFTQIFML